MVGESSSGEAGTELSKVAGRLVEVAVSEVKVDHIGVVVRALDNVARWLCGCHLDIVPRLRFLF